MKNRNHLRCIAIALATALLGSALTACGNKPAETPSSTPASEPAPASSAPAEPETDADPFGKYDPPITLKAVRWLNSYVKFDESNPETKSLEENVWADAWRDQLGIELDYLWTPNQDQYTQKWNVALASGQLPDIGVVDINLYKQLVQGGLVEDMTDIYATYASDTYKKMNEDENNNAITYMTFDGKLMGLPMPGTVPDAISTMFIRQDWLNKVNKEIPTTVDELLDVVKAFQDAKLGGDDTVGIAITKSPGDGEMGLRGLFEAFNAHYDVWLDDGNGNLIYSTVAPEMREALLKLQQMYKDGMFRQDFSVLDGSQAGQDIASGKCGISFGTYWAPLVSLGSNSVSDTDAEWVVAEIPTVDGSPYKSSAAATPAWFIFVRKGMEHPEAAVKLANLDYKLTAEDPSKYNVDATKDGIERSNYKIYAMGGPWANLNTWAAVTDAITAGSDASLDAINKTTYSSVKAALDGDRAAIGTALVFGPNSTYAMVNRLKNENRILQDGYQTLPTDTMSRRKADIGALLDSAILNVINGEDISAFDEAVEAWKAGGGDTMTEEVNAWYHSK